MITKTEISKFIELCDIFYICANSKGIIRNSDEKNFCNELTRLVNTLEIDFPVQCAKIEQIWNLRRFNQISLNLTLQYIKSLFSEILNGYDVQYKMPKIFISHSTDDKNIIEKFVTLLEQIGVKQNHLFCSSVAGYGIAQGSGNIYDYIRDEMNSHNLFVILMLSDNYYKSPACLNEMGAAWIKQSKYQSILLPGFDYRDIKGAIDPYEISFKLDDIANRSYALNELYSQIVNHLEIEEIDHALWERMRDQFIGSIDAIT